MKAHMYGIGCYAANMGLMQCPLSPLSPGGHERVRPGTGAVKVASSKDRRRLLYA